MSELTKNIQTSIATTFYVEDVTDNAQGFQIAVDIAVKGYSKLSSYPLDAVQVQEELFRDAYHTSGSTRTLLLQRYNSLTGKMEPLGTLRVLIGSMSKGVNPPFEAMDLLIPEGGWENFSFADFNAELAIELGRFAIVPNIEKTNEQGVSWNAIITYKLIEAAYNLGVSRHRNCQLWAVMSRKAVRTVEESGITLLPAPCINFNEKHQSLFEKYDRYWKLSNPWLYRVILPEKGLSFYDNE